MEVGRLKKLVVGKSNRSIIQLFRYGLVVGIAAPIDLGGYILLKSQLHIYYILAATISFTVSLLVNYFLSIAWVWTAHSGKQRRVDAVVFGVIGLVGLGLTDVVVYLLTDVVHLNYIISKLCALCIVFSWSFGARRFLFLRRPLAAPES